MHSQHKSVTGRPTTCAYAHNSKSKSPIAIALVFWSAHPGNRSAALVLPRQAPILDIGRPHSAAASLKWPRIRAIGGFGYLVAVGCISDADVPLSGLHEKPTGAWGLWVLTPVGFFLWHGYFCACPMCMLDAETSPQHV